MTHPCPKKTTAHAHEPCAVCDPCCQHAGTERCTCDLDWYTDEELTALYVRLEKASEKAGHTGPTYARWDAVRELFINRLCVS